MKSNGENIALPEFDFHSDIVHTGSQMLKVNGSIFPFVPVHGTKMCPSRIARAVSAMIIRITIRENRVNPVIDPSWPMPVPVRSIKAGIIETTDGG